MAPPKVTSCLTAFARNPIGWSGLVLPMGKFGYSMVGPLFPPPFPRVSVRLLDPGVVGRRGTVVLPEEEMAVRRTAVRVVRCQEPTSSGTI